MKKNYLLLLLIFGLISCDYENQNNVNKDNPTIVKLAIIEPLSGPNALAGQMLLEHLKYVVSLLNERNKKITYEVVEFDNKGSPQDALIALNNVIDMGIKFIIQGSGSHIGLALSDAIEKYNQRNPGSELIYLNSGAISDSLTNENCHFWHFRFDSSVSIKVNSLTSALSNDPKLNKLYLINPDYSYGHDVNKIAKKNVQSFEHEMTIVGEEFIPLFKVKDFSPYVSKIIESKANIILSGNFGPDLTLFVKALGEAGYKGKIYTLYSHLTGTPKAIGKYGENMLVGTSPFQPNLKDYPLNDFYLSYKEKYQNDWVFQPIKYLVEMLHISIINSKSLNSEEIALNLETINYDGGLGNVQMRKTDHQLMLPIFISEFVKTDKEVIYDADKTGYGWKEIYSLSFDKLNPNHTCEMNRP